MKEESTMRSSPHQEHRDWLSQLDFYSEELRIFERELQKSSRSIPTYCPLLST
ncbi:MAG: hypothetical protein IPK21_14100 [Haliscomenobacter sp.]|nr:hypothetical protein [Haliscomenobacter sp.]